ncbi:MAG: hypothetical protein A4E48_00242 [Methanosaeta sp. PtaU1.Bin060]|nr:MAG: hypothetical protein A4E48_00242 [Methanosaeta sp. PtaU1.Bin060]
MKTVISLDYYEALLYFNTDADIFEALEVLDEKEREGFVLEITLDHEHKAATYSMGHRGRETAHLAQKDRGIDNTHETEDDYVGACEALHEMGESLGLGTYMCEHCDAIFEYGLPWQQTCEVCGRLIGDDNIVHEDT